jgi:general secretion pathway protein A
MYKNYYGFSSAPFDLTPNPDVVYMSETHQEAMAILRYGVVGKKGFLVLTGDVGTGKTTLLQALVHSLDMEVHLCLINNPTLTRDEFFSFVARSYTLPWEQNKAFFLIEFAEFLQRCRRNSERVLLIIDEAHAMDEDLLEEIRLLSNQDKMGQDVLSIFLVGQPELNPLMGSDRLLALRQRVGIRFHLEPFSLEETRQYILYRLRQANAHHLNIFSDDAISLIYQVSKGTPRLINIICDHALLTGFSQGEPIIKIPIIKECIRELRFPGEDTPLPLPATLKEKSSLQLMSRKMLYVLLGVFVVLFLLEIIPATRSLSPLSAILPDNLLDSLHHLIGTQGE